ncbi:hypothetical protein [Chroococcidiopsis sp.]|uniref:hypothetical protein n=1 Tax=Chroococcidiopsis sp. TaxID=3088168 RepID=UPI003F3BF9E2
MKSDFADYTNVRFETEIETRIAHELTQKLVENQLKIIEKAQNLVLSDINSTKISIVTEAIEGLEILLSGLKAGDFVIVAKP